MIVLDVLRFQITLSFIKGFRSDQRFSPLLYLLNHHLYCSHFGFLPLEIICDHLPNPNNANRTCSTPDRSIGTVCELRCDSGYEFKPGVATNVTCVRGGETRAQWSTQDDELDPCQSKCHLL